MWRNFRCLPMTDVEKSEILHIWHVCDVENLCYIGCKISFVTIYALCCEMCFVATYVLLCGDKFIQFLCVEKLQIWDLKFLLNWNEFTLLRGSLSYPPIQKQAGLCPARSYKFTTSICLSNPEKVENSSVFVVNWKELLLNKPGGTVQKSTVYLGSEYLGLLVLTFLNH